MMYHRCIVAWSCAKAYHNASQVSRTALHYNSMSHFMYKKDVYDAVGNGSCPAQSRAPGGSACDFEGSIMLTL